MLCDPERVPILLSRNSAIIDSDPALCRISRTSNATRGMVDKMRPAQDWTEADIQLLLNEQTPEELSLEYKAAGALKKNELCKREISKDVSAMANSAGGTIVYGVNERRATNGPIVLDAIDPGVVSLEWIEQVIDSNIKRRIPGLTVHRIDVSSAPARCLYVVSVPSSVLAPHMAGDHCYHKRLGTITAKMEEYEVRDVSRRVEAPDLYLSLETQVSFDALVATVHLRNSSSVPALYASLRLFAPVDWQPAPASSLLVADWKRSGLCSVRTNLWTQKFASYFRHWAVPNDPAILDGVRYPAGQLFFLTRNIQPPQAVVWEIRSPHMTPMSQALTITNEDRLDLRVSSAITQAIDPMV